MISVELFGHPDFIAVRAELIRQVGAVEAIVLTRIHFRASETYRHAYERDGFWWWRAPAPVIAIETGLTEKQVKRALTVLRDAGHIVAEQHQVEGNYDRALSIRVALEGTVDRPHRDDEDRPHRDDVPYKEIEDTPLPPRGSADFDEIWEAWPKKVAKDTAQRGWNKIPQSKREEIKSALLVHAKAHADHTPKQYMPRLSTYLRDEVYLEDAPGPRLSRGETPGGYTPLPVPKAGDQPLYYNGTLVHHPSVVLVKHDMLDYPLGYQAVDDPRPRRRSAL